MPDGNVDLAGRHILIVEDDALVGLGLVENLEELGAEVTWVTDLDAAIAAVGAQGELDLAVVDLNLDGVSSTPVIERLNEAAVPVILCTGYDLELIEHRFQHLARCEKPFTRAKIQHHLKAVL